jgi:hypothetical protein
MPTWDNLNEAFAYLQRYLRSKQTRDRFKLSEIDLALVRNFKGGNASVVEPIGSLTPKLKAYSTQLERLSTLIGDRPLHNMQDRLSDLKHQGELFLLLTIDGATKIGATKIKGFGPANASALLAAYFTETLPVIDRLVLLGAGIDHERNSQHQAIGIEKHYSSLIEKCHPALNNNPQLSLRDLDKKWFDEGRKKSKELRLLSQPT